MKRINEEEYKKNLQFQFKELNKKRDVLLENVMPANGGIKYCIFFTPCYISKLSMKKIHSFDELFELTNENYNENSFIKIAKKYIFIEDIIKIDKEVKNIIKEISGNSSLVYIKCLEDSQTTYYYKTELEKYFQPLDLIEGIPITSGEYRIHDEENNWYLLFRDDDPFAYFASDEVWIKKLVKLVKSQVIPVSSSMLYGTNIKKEGQL